jgi:hypothetical protein
LHDAPDLGDRRWVGPQADGQVGDQAAVVERHLAAGRRDVLALAPDQAHELLVRAADGI